MKSGNIFIDKEGTDISKIEVGKREQVLRDYYVMREAARKNKDKFFYVNSQEWEDFLSNIWSQDNSYWDGVDMNYITALQEGAFPQRLIDDISVFNALSDPKSHGGFGYDGHPTTDYVHNSETWEDWHSKFYYEHPEEIDWTGTNGIMPCREKIIDILRKELQKLQSSLSSNDNNNLCGLSHEQIQKIKNTEWENVTSETIVSEHNDIVIKHKGDQIKAYSEEIGSRICSLNYYHHEAELESKCSVSPHITDTHMSFSPLPANASRGGLLFFILPKLRKKSIKFILGRCLYVFQHMTEPTLGIFIQHLASSKQRVHHRCSLASIQVTTEQIRFFAHHHVANQSLCIRIIYRHLRDVQVMSKLVIVANQIIQRLKD